MDAEFKIGDFVLIDCSREPKFGVKAHIGEIIVIYGWPSVSPDKYGCAYESDLPNMTVSVWCRADQIKLRQLEK